MHRELERYRLEAERGVSMPPDPAGTGPLDGRRGRMQPPLQLLAAAPPPAPPPPLLLSPHVSPSALTGSRAPLSAAACIESLLTGGTEQGKEF